MGQNCFGTVVILNALFGFFTVYSSYMRKKEFLIGSGFIEKLEIFSGPSPITIPSDLINLFAVLLQILSPVPQISILYFLETDKFGNFCIEIRSVLMSLCRFL